jgi:hypothetical protein
VNSCVGFLVNHPVERFNTCHDVAHEARIRRLTPWQPHRPICSSMTHIRVRCRQNRLGIAHACLNPVHGSSWLQLNNDRKAHLRRQAGRPSARVPTWH